MSAMDKAAQQHKRAMLMTNRANFSECVGIMKENPDTVPHVRNTLRQLGFLQKGSNADLGGFTACGPPTAAGGGEEEEGGMCAAKEEVPDPDADIVPNLQLPANFTTLGGQSSGLNGPWLLYLLAMAEPILLSRHAARALVPTGKRAVPKELAWQVLEFMTNLDPETELDPNLRSVDACVAAVQLANAELGRRMNDIRLPPDWNKSGHYNIACASQASLSVVDKRSDTEIELDREALGLSSSVDMRNFSIEKNFSYTRAALVLKGGFKRFVLNPVFTKNKIKAPTPAKSKTEPMAALEDSLTKPEPVEPPLSTDLHEQPELPASFIAQPVV